MLICVIMYLIIAFEYIYSSMSSIKDQGLGPDHMDKSVSQEQSISEGYKMFSDPGPTIDRVAHYELQRDPSYGP
jgi:hypothetical protein